MNIHQSVTLKEHTKWRYLALLLTLAMKNMLRILDLEYPSVDLILHFKNFRPQFLA